FLDVGQGDAALINDGEFEILIDAGISAEGTKVVQYLSDYVDGDLDVVVASHEDADHIGGLPAVFDAYTIEEVVDNGRTSSTKTYQTYHNKVQAEGADYAADTAAQNITLPSGATLEFLPITDVYDNANDNSVVTMLTYGDVEVLFTGDLSSDVADANSSLFSDVDVLKAGHHGSRTSVSSQFLQTTKPEYVVISAGLDNSYGHPHKEALSAYLNTGADVYGTFRSGDIVMTTDGQQISFDTTEKLTLSDVGAKSNGTTPVQKPVTQPEQPSKPVAETTVTYVGNKNSKIFHRASCSSVSRMKDSNKVSLNSRDAAISQGYRPCENCQP
ncbi:MBL fold metallo-hydrolase, partial [Anaerotignum lactatifermentans]